MRYFLTVLILFGLFSSCQKERGEEFTGIYESSSMEVMPVRLFVKNREVSDKSIIVQFVKSHWSKAFIMNTDTVVDVRRLIKVKFLPENESIFIFKEDSSRRFVGRNSNVICFEAGSTYTQYNNSTSVVFDSIKGYDYLYSRTTPIAGNTGYLSKTEYKHCYFAQFDGDEIRFPLITYLYISSYPSSYSSVGEFRLNNVFNERSVAFLSDNDTLAIQQCHVFLERNN